MSAGGQIQLNSAHRTYAHARGVLALQTDDRYRQASVLRRDDLNTGIAWAEFSKLAKGARQFALVAARASINIYDECFHLE